MSTSTIRLEVPADLKGEFIRAKAILNIRSYSDLLTAAFKVFKAEAMSSSERSVVEGKQVKKKGKR